MQITMMHLIGGLIFLDKKDIALTTLVLIHIITLGLYWLRAHEEMRK